jgi:formyl-CoA transferase
MVPYDVFATADGWLAIAVATEDQWRDFCGALGRPELATDDRFATNPERARNRDALAKIVDPILAGSRTADWAERLRAADVPCGPVNSIGDVLDDPQVAAADLVRTIERPAGAIEVVGNPLRFDSGPLPATAPPALGADTDAVLAEAGIDAARIRSLRERGVIR